ncbi:hypothetical protein SOVF_181800 [Spinacia oleracea]|nr:hypothetical protein SOVF_181800 [Spinacia oleracea]
MAPKQPASTSGCRPGKEPVTDDVDMAIGEYSDGDSIFEDSAGKGVDEHWGGGGDEAGVSGRDGMEASDNGIGSDDDDPADVIVADVLADEAKEQPYFTDDATDVHRKGELPPLDSLPRTKTLDRDILGFDENWKPVCTQPPPPKAKYDTISTYSTRASSRRSTTTVAKNRVSAACKSKSSSVAVSKAPPSSTMQSNPTGRGGNRRKRSSLNTSRSNPTKRTKATGEDDVLADLETNEPVLESAAKKTADSTIQVHPSPQASLEIFDTEGPGGDFDENLHRQATSAAVTGGNSSMPPVSRSENKSGDSRLNYHLPLRTGGWIEDTPFKIPPQIKSWFETPGGEPTDQFYPTIDLLCGESVATDSAKDGGDLGYRAFKDLITPADRPQGQIDAPAAQHFNDLYKLQLTQDNIDMADLRRWAEDAESSLEDSKKKLDTMTSDLEVANKRLQDIEPRLQSETERANGLDQQLTNVNEGLPGVKKSAAKRAVDKLL